GLHRLMVMRGPRFGWGFNKRLAASESRRGVKQESLRCGKRMRWAWPASAAALLASCWWIPRPAVAPLRTVSLPGAPGRDFEELWTWLRGYATGESARPPLWLGYGESDRYAYGHRLLAAALRRERALVGPGAHDWPTRQRQRADFLAPGGSSGLGSRSPSRSAA